MESHSTLTKATVVSITVVVGSGHVRTKVVPHLQRIRSNQPGIPEVGVEHAAFLFVGCVLLISDHRVVEPEVSSNITSFHGIFSTGYSAVSDVHPR